MCDDVELLGGILGTLRAGAVGVPVSTMLAAHELAKIVADSGARVVCATTQYVDTVAAAIDLAPEVGHFVLAGAGALPALSTASARVGRTSLLWGERARARTARWPAPTRMPVRCGSTPRAPRVRPRVRCTDTPTSGTSARPTASRCWGSGRRTCACRWPSSSSLTAWATRRGSRSPRERPRSWNHVTRRLRSSPGG